MGGGVSSLSRSQTSRDRLLSDSSESSALYDAPLQCLEPFLLSGVRDAGRELGRGSYAVVRELEVRGKRVAGKRLHESMYWASPQEQRDDILTRFARECNLLQSVKHPNIVRFLGVHVEPDVNLPYLVMEYVDVALATYLERNGVPEAPVYYNILSDVALGLRYLHQQNPPILHRDFTANNVLLTSSLQAKITDLGVSKVLDITPSEKLRVTQTRAPGTQCYMPPEALVDRPHYDTTIDVFSYGVLIIHILCSDWPLPSAPTKIDPTCPDAVLPVTEFERRKRYITKIGLDHPAVPLIRKCIHNSSANRPNINTVTRLIMDLQLGVDQGKVYHPRLSYEPTTPGEISVGVGDDVRVFGSGRKLLKTYCLSSTEVGYVPADILRQIQHCPMATALYTSTAETQDGLSVAAGDMLYILSVDNEEWWFAVNDATNKSGFIPCNYMTESLSSYRWYLGNTSHSEADTLLKREKNSTGSFLVHDECQDIRCLSVRGKESILHYKIESKNGLMFIVNKDKFKTLQDLVYHYSTHQSSGGVLCTCLRHPYHVPRGDDEVERNAVRLSHKTGKGPFGEVWKGLKGETHVTVKVLTPGATTTAEFLKEAATLSQLDHRNIIRCEGVCSSDEPVYMLMEFTKYGSLLDYLQKGEGRGVHFLDLVNLGLQVSGGMAYLERQGYLHCDLAARSVAMGDDKVCKIQNFEKARRAQSFKLPPRTSVPIRWTAPEVFSTNEYTTKADVWSFGVVLQEIVTRGGRPYNDMSNEETLKAVQSGYRIPQPPTCPRGLYEMMLKCWRQEPSDRLRFEAIEWQLEEFFTSQCFEDKTYIAPFQIRH